MWFQHSIITAIVVFAIIVILLVIVAAGEFRARRKCIACGRRYDSFIWASSGLCNECANPGE
jgi:cytochrome b